MYKQYHDDNVRNEKTPNPDPDDQQIKQKEKKEKEKTAYLNQHRLWQYCGKR